MVRSTAKSTYFKELLFPFFKIFYKLIVHHVINFVFSIGKQPYRDVINFVSYIHVVRGVPRIWEGGGQEFFFSDLGICMSRSDMLRMAKPCALLGGFGGMLPREKIFKTVQFGAF